MIKKISAAFLALVLCLSVVVLPASAAGLDDYEFEAGKSVAFKVEFDKATYNPGDTVRVSLYMKIADLDAQIKSGYIVLGFDENVFDAEASEANIPKSAVACDAWEGYWEDANSTANWGYLGANATILKNINAARTEDEMYMNKYIRFALAKSVEKVVDDTYGVLATDINEQGPFVSFDMKLRDDVAPGTEIKMAVPNASITMKPAQTVINYLTNIGVKNTGKAYAATTYDNGGNTVTTIAGSATILSPIGSQIRFNTENDVYAGNFDYRYRAVISGADFAETFGSEDDAKEMITDIGFVFAEGTDAFTMAQAKDVVENGSDVAGVTKKAVSYIQNRGSDYMFTCLITGITDKTKSCTVLAYVGIDTDADGVADTFSYYPTVVSSSFEALYDQYKSNVQGA